MSWSAQQYSKFERDRTRPVRDLVAAIPTQDVRRAIDLGCGPGNSTEVLLQRYPEAEVSGLDSSEDMLAAARKRLPDLRFELADIATWNPCERYDVILANAALQWLPDHATLYPRLAGLLAEGGSLAVQTPDNLGEPMHQLAQALAASPQWRDRIGPLEQRERHEARFYYDLLRPHCRSVDIWRTTYFHVLEGGSPAVVEWFRSTALRPYLGPLDAQGQAEFLAAYGEAIARAYPENADGTVLMAMPRLFVVATR